MALQPEWQYRIEHWQRLLPKLWFTPVAEVELAAQFTYDQLTPAQAARGKFAPLPAGTAWGPKWQYAWLKGKVKIPAACKGRRVALQMGVSGECVVYLDGAAAGHRDWAHPLLTLARTVDVFLYSLHWSYSLNRHLHHYFCRSDRFKKFRREHDRKFAKFLSRYIL